jgi:hypothetical protein
MEYSFPDGLFDFTLGIDVSCYKRLTSVYFAFADEDDYNRFMSNDYAKCKVGMHVIKPGSPASIERQVDDRASQCARGTTFYNCPCFLIIPGDVKRNTIDNIIRETIHPIVSSVIDPIYKSDYTVKQRLKRLKKENADDFEIKKISHAKEIAYHMRQFEIGIIFSLIYSNIYGLPIPEWIGENFPDVFEPRIFAAIRNIVDLSKAALKSDESSESEMKDEMFSTNVTKCICFRKVDDYKRLLDVHVDSSDNVIIVSTNPKDAEMIVDSIEERPSNIVILYTEDIKVDDMLDKDWIQESLMSRSTLDEYYHKGTVVIANIPSNGNQTIKTLENTIKLLQPSMGRLAFICDESLTHSAQIFVSYYDSMMNERYRNVCIGSKRVPKEAFRIFDRLGGHVTSVRLDNLNKEYGTNSMRSWLTVHVDMSQNKETFPFVCHGEERTVHNLKECTMFGHPVEYREILKKVLQRFPVSLNEVIYTKREIIKRKKDMFCIPYKSISGSPVKNMRSSYSRNEIHGLPAWMMDSLYSTMHPFIKLSDELYRSANIPNGSLFVCGSLEETRNYMHNAKETKLMRFIAAMNSFQTRPILNSESIPFIADKKYTDAELADEIGLNRRECAVIDDVLKMARVGSPFIQKLETGRVDESPVIHNALF